jgi:hypothetical protein
MGVNPEELYNQQKRIQQDHQRAAHNAAHGTIETWQIEKESAQRGEFVRDPMDKANQKPGLIARLLKMLRIRK